MNRRELLKFSLLAPFLSLFKKKEKEPLELFADGIIDGKFLTPPEVKWFSLITSEGVYINEPQGITKV